MLCVCALTALPVACGGNDDDADNNADPDTTGETGGTTFGTGGQAPFAPSTGLTAGSVGGTMGTAPDPSGGSSQAGEENPAYDPIPFSRCVPEFCTPVPGAEVCCQTPDGPCGADYGRGCERPREGTSGTGGFSWGGFGGFGGFGAFAGFGGFGASGATGGTAGGGVTGDAGLDDAGTGPPDGSAGAPTAVDASTDATAD